MYSRIKSLRTSLCLLSAGKRYQREGNMYPSLAKGGKGGFVKKEKVDE